MRLTRLCLLLVLLTGCGSAPTMQPRAESFFESSEAERNCKRASEFAAGGASLESLDLGTVRPPLPEGIEALRGVVLDPQPLGYSRGSAEPPLVPAEPDRRKVVLIGTTSIGPPEMRRRFDAELQRLGLGPSKTSGETRLSGKLVSFAFSYNARGVEGNVVVGRCGPLNQVQVSQTLLP